jgi:hypothetical protein
LETTQRTCGSKLGEFAVGYSKQASIDGFRVVRTWGTTRWTQRFERRGLYGWDLRSQWNTETEASRRRKAQRTAERDTKLYPSSGPLWWGKAPTSCLLVLRRDTSRGVQGLGYRALTGRM